MNYRETFVAFMVHLQRMNYLDEFCLKCSRVVITEVASCNKLSTLKHTTFMKTPHLLNVMSHNVGFLLTQSNFCDLNLQNNRSGCWQGSYGWSPLTESQEAHEQQDDHSVQEVARVADGRQRSAGSVGRGSAAGRPLVLLSQQATPLFVVRHVRLFGMWGTKKLTAAEEDHMTRQRRHVACSSGSSKRACPSGVFMSVRVPVKLKQLALKSLVLWVKWRLKTDSFTLGRVLVLKQGILTTVDWFSVCRIYKKARVVRNRSNSAFQYVYKMFPVSTSYKIEWF